MEILGFLYIFARMFLSIFGLVMLLKMTAEAALRDNSEKDKGSKD